MCQQIVEASGWNHHFTLRGKTIFKCPWPERDLLQLLFTHDYLDFALVHDVHVQVNLLLFICFGFKFLTEILRFFARSTNHSSVVIAMNWRCDFFESSGKIMMAKKGYLYTKINCVRGDKWRAPMREIFMTWKILFFLVESPRAANSESLSSATETESFFCSGKVRLVPKLNRTQLVTFKFSFTSSLIIRKREDFLVRK